MDEQGNWPIPIIATQDVACGVRLWSTSGRTRATVVVKSTFYLVRGGPMRLVNPAPILIGDQHHDGNVERSVLAPSDVSPYLPRAEVVFSGHAYAPTPSPFVPVRLAIVGSRPLVDKTLHVFGERMWLDGDQMTAPVPFTRIPIRYERSYRGPVGFEDNPIGMPKGQGLPVHNVVDPQDPEAPAGLGAVAPYWPTRRRLLRNLDPAVLAAREPALPDTFAWSFFHAAPADQRCSFFEGNEWIVLEGLHPEHARFESQLPGGRARARLYSLESTSHREVSLTADTIWIDGDRSMCCVLWRGNFEVEDGMLQNVQLFAGLEMPNRSIPWPGVSAAPPEPPKPPAPPAEETLHSSAHAAAIAVAVPRQGSGQYAAVPQAAAPRPGSGQHAAAQPSATSGSGQHAAVQAPADRGSGQFAAVAPQPEATGSDAHATPLKQEVTGATQAFAPTASLLAALAEDGSQPVVRQSTREWQPGQTLASPGAAAAAQLAAAALRKEAATKTPGPESAPIEVDPRWLEAPRPAPVVEELAGSLSMPGSGIPSSGSTITHPPAELQQLIDRVRQETSPVTVAKPNFDDSPTLAPDEAEIALLLQKAEQEGVAAEEDDKAHLGARPSPAALRAQKTTIRGLGSGKAEPPPTTRVGAGHLLQGEEMPTAQLPIPDVLLKLAAQPASQKQPPEPAIAPLIQEAQAPAVELDEDETGRPTLTEMEAPPVSAAQPPPQVHKGETRMEVERRIREGETLAGLDLSDLDLSGFDFSGKSLVGCRFDRGNLRRCRLRGADLSGASLEGADLSETELDDAKLERTNLVSAKLTGASLRSAFLTDANLTTADARRAVFDRASGQRTIFSRARLDGASACGAQLDTADFTEAQLDGANFEGSLLPDLKAYEVSAEDTSFVRASLKNARFDGGVLGRARFDAAMAEDSMWDRAVLDGASFEGANLCGGSFTKASLRGCNLSGADLGEARFNRANLSGAKFLGVDLGRLTLDGADLSGIVTSE